MAWWIKKKKKICKCPCHWSALMATLNPQDKHCETCEEQLKVEKRLKRLSGGNQRKKLINKLDDTVSLIVRIKADWTCVKCLRRYPPNISQRTRLPAQNLMTTSHYWSRSKMGTRWDYNNLDALDLFCHQKVENEKKNAVEGFIYEQFMRNKLGDDGYDLLEYRASSLTRYSEFDLKIMLENEQKTLEILLKQYE